MKKYYVHCEVRSAEGADTFVVMAESEDDAEQRWRRGEGEFLESTINATNYYADKLVVEEIVE